MSTTEAQVNPNLAALVKAGTSPWLDQIRRTLVEGGELARMVREESLRGVTSNPSIFEKAILGSTDYDEELEAAAREQLDASAIYERLAMHDVQAAADVLSEVYEASHHHDGFVSMEVAPELAHDTEGTLNMARSYWQRLGRPNVMIKIPGTREGVKAIEEAISEGINVNVTLLFAVEAHERVAEAFLRGLERRLAAGESVDVHSVASFFVSRVDTAVDKRLDELGHEELKGKAAIANARNAYRRFREIFSGPRWEPLHHAGAAVQRPLWASTGVKNPAYSDVMYVDELAGPHTVNTMPLATLLAVADHGHIHGPTAAIDPSDDLKALEQAGIDLEEITEALLVDGIKQFEDAMSRLLEGIESRRAAVITGRPPTIEATIPKDLQEPVAARAQRAVAENVAQRVWRRDPTLWGASGTSEIEDRLGWLTVSETMLEHAPDIHAFAEECREEGFTDAVLLGMGGSSLGPEVIRRSFGSVPGRPRAPRPRLDPPRRDPGAGGIAHRPRHSVHRVLEVRVDDRDAVALPLLQGQGAAAPVRDDHRPGQPARAGRARRGPAPLLPEPARHRRALLGAVVLRARARRALGREHRGAPAPSSGGGADVRPLRLEPVELRSLARSGAR
jgi:transaldolase